MLNTIARNLKDKTSLGQQLQSLPSIIEYPEYYRLGKISVRGVFCKYGHEITDFASAEYHIETGDCPTCFIMEEKYGQYIHGEGPEDCMEWGEL